MSWQGTLLILSHLTLPDPPIFYSLVFIVLSLIFALLAGFFIDRFLNRRIFISIGCILYLLGFTLSILKINLGYSFIGPNIDIFLITIIQGIAFGITNISIGAYFGDISHPKDRGRLQGFIYFISFIIVFGMLYLLVLFPIGLTLFLLSFLIVFFLLFQYLFVPLSRSESVEPSSYSTIFKNKSFMYFVISFLLFMIALPFIQIFFNGTITLEFRTLIYYLYFPLLAGFALIGGYFCIDRYGRKSMILVFFLILGLGFTIWGILSPTTEELLPILIVWTLFGAGNAITNTVDYIIPADYASPHSRGKYVAVFFVATNTGLLISTGLQGFIVTLPIASIALIVTSLLLFAIAPIILTTKPLEEALAREVDVKGVYVISQDGRCLFEMSFKDVLIDADLITSALSAVGSLIKESIHSEQKLESIDHGDVKILVEYGIVNAAVIADKETPDLRVRLEKFLNRFVYDYREYLEAFTGDLRPFYQAYKLIEQYFGVYLAEK
ncbi:MAG: MFS transporter [Candidatus Helarchaeota archaeon]|nr:MFS transporter [Candidatus Helarchaeota archaeon]